MLSLAFICWPVIAIQLTLRILSTARWFWFFTVILSGCMLLILVLLNCWRFAHWLSVWLTDWLTNWFALGYALRGHIIIFIAVIIVVIGWIRVILLLLSVGHSITLLAVLITRITTDRLLNLTWHCTSKSLIDSNSFDILSVYVVLILFLSILFLLGILFIAFQYDVLQCLNVIVHRILLLFLFQFF